MRNQLFASVAALAFVFAGNVFGAGAATSGGAPMCESVFGANVGGGHSTTGGTFAFGGGAWAVGATAAYHHLAFDPIQLGGTVGLAFGDAGTGTVTAISAMVGPTFNFMNTVAGDISDAAFIFAGVGLQITDPGSTDFQFGAEVGKRFKVWDNISYRPSFGFKKVGSGSLLFSANLLNISVLY